ncbi:MAG: BT_3987 domain-containing protein [Cyclobacteriaceae bacterium]
MKNLNIKYLSLVAIASIAVILSGCFANDNFTDFSKVGSVVEFINGIAGAESAVSASIPYNAVEDGTVSVKINVTGQYAPSQDVSVTLAIDPQSLVTYNTVADKFNIDHPDEQPKPIYEQLPNDYYSIPNLTITVKAGERVANLLILAKSSKFDLSKKYVLPLKIASVTSGFIISGNIGVILQSISVKNKYDGSYHSTGTFTRLGVTRPIDRDKYLSTVDATTNNTEFADLGPSMNLTVNPDNTITLVPKDGANSGTVQLNTSPGDNTYDPVTKTYSIHYAYGGGTREGIEKITLK